MVQTRSQTRSTNNTTISCELRQTRSLTCKVVEKQTKVSGSKIKRNVCDRQTKRFTFRKNKVAKNVSKINIGLLHENFTKCVTGYHSINESPINETMWESINILVFKTMGIKIFSNSGGGHSSGMDIDSSVGRLSNKSAKYSIDKKSGDMSFSMSSYRLTTVCNTRCPGKTKNIVAEINRRKNFDYYSIIVRDDSHSNRITYDWLMIPSNHTVFNPSSYKWSPTIGQRGINEGTQTGWHTNYIDGCKMSITFSMSSQLWIHIDMSPKLRQYVVSSVTVSNTQQYSYIDICDRLCV